MASNPFSAAAVAGAITQPPTGRDYLVDRSFRSLALVGAVLIIALMAYILYEIGGQAWPAISKYHIDFLTTSAWNVQDGVFGILPVIWGTLYSSLLALLIGGFFGLTVAIFLSQDFLPPRLAFVFRTIIEMLAAIPSVVFGLWGIFVVIPAIRPVANWLHESFGWIPFFSTSLSGPGLAPATIVLAIMILPTVAAISQDALNLVPYRTKEAAYGMGATRWEAILKVMVPTAAGGIFSAMVLGFGRALGETMALAMLIGNSNTISLSLFSPAKTLASLLASNFPEAGPIEVEALMYAALVLLLITLIVNIAGIGILQVTQRRISGKS
ncbi:MAG: phosphate ABC transporter permease subunit PstC [Rhodospirillales bacterium]|jgi:phosphate transport system permease protein|nr:phosphate ABC transporter permease subunit PstC [Rhodospirillales bacterium]